jgi:hypothetical protein
MDLFLRKLFYSYMFSNLINYKLKMINIDIFRQETFGHFTHMRKTLAWHVPGWIQAFQ